MQRQSRPPLGEDHWFTVAAGITTLHDVVHREALHDYDPEPDVIAPSRHEALADPDLRMPALKRGPVVDGYERIPADCEEDEEGLI